LILENDFTPGTNAAVSTLVGTSDDPAAGTILTVSSWGPTTGGGSNCVKADLTCISRAECNRILSTNAITSAMICAHDTSRSVCYVSIN
jgi:hypothetical protein